MRLLFLLQLSFLIILGCHDEIVYPGEGANPDIHASCLITVRDLNGQPVYGAYITIEGNQATTDAHGISYFDHVLLKQRSLMIIEKDGFLTGYYRFGTFEDNVQFEDVVLLPQTPQGNFLNILGGLVNIGTAGSGHEVSLQFPTGVAANLDGSAYNGYVQVIAQPVYADDPLFSQKMQGVALALDHDDHKGMLISYGMLAIELRSSTGALLKIAEGKEMILSVSVPNAITQVPVSVPMWYFDEEKKYWIESGEATRFGNNFSTKLNHFSLWNIATWSPYVILTGTVATSVGTSLSGVPVSITLPEHNISTHDRTNNQGRFISYIPQNSALHLDINGNCNSLLHTENLGPFSANTDIHVTVSENVNSSMINGYAQKCNGEPVTHSYIIVNNETSYTIYMQESVDGSFALPVYDCIGSKLYLRMVDIDEEKSSVPVLLQMTNQNDVGILTTCDSLAEFLRFTVTGFSPEYLYYFIKFDRDITKTSKSTRIGTLDEIGPDGIMILYADDIVAGYYENTACTCVVNLPNGEVAQVSALNLTISEYGAIGEYVRGTFTGHINKGNNGHGGEGASDFSGSFSVKRTY